MSQSLDQLVSTAIEQAAVAREGAYAPYSDFKMGAAIVSADGEVVRGSLVENVSLGLAMCSERVAMFAAVTEGVTPAVLAVASRRTDGELTFPCGACLQVALELGGPDLVVAAVDPDGESDTAVLSELLPRAPHRHSPAG